MLGPGLAMILHRAAVACAFATVVVLGLRPIVHDDVFFHLRTGEIVARTGVVPDADSFTHTVPGTPWITHEWGFGLLLEGAYRLGGLPALVGVVPLVVVCTFLALHLLMQCSVRPTRRVWLVWLLLLGAGAAARACFILRAALFTSLGLALVAVILDRLSRRRTAVGVAALGVVLLVWANVHAGVVFGLLVLGLHVVQAVFDRWLLRASGWRWSMLLRGEPLARAGLLLGGAGVTLVNPNGVDVWRFPFHLHHVLYGSGLTYDMGIFASPTLARHPLFFVLVAMTLAACLPLSRLRRVLADPRRPALMWALGTAFFLVMALRSHRFVLDFVIFALPFCAMCWGGRVGEAGDGTGAVDRWVALRAGVGVVVAGVSLVAAVRAQPLPPPSVLAEHVPVRLADFMERERITGRMFNAQAFGGYLGWRLRQPVYWDGRNDIFGPLAEEVARASDFGALERRHALDIAALNPAYDRRFGDYLRAHQDEWGLVYWDRAASLYVKRTPRFERVLQRWEYRLLRPFAAPRDAEWAQWTADPALTARVQVELDNATAQAPESFLPWYLRGRLDEGRGDKLAAHTAYQRAAAIAAHPDTFYRLARLARDLGRPDEARAYLDRYMDLVAR